MLAASRRPLLLAAITGTSLALAACEEDGTLRPDRDTLVLVREAERATPWTPTEQEQVTISLTMDSVIAPKQHVPMTITVHNGSGRPISIGFGRKDPFQVIVVRDPGGGAAGGRAGTEPIWSPGSTLDIGRGAVITDPLRPGRDTAFQVIWPAQDDAGHYAPPGIYRVRAYVAAELLRTNRIWTPWRQIEIR